jgi:hypothetical protein
MEAGVAMGLISMLGVLAVYFWVVRRSHKEIPTNQQATPE